MTEFTLHTLDSAPAVAKPLIQKAEQKLGFIPNQMAIMADNNLIMKNLLEDLPSYPG